MFTPFRIRTTYKADLPDIINARMINPDIADQVMQLSESGVLVKRDQITADKFCAQLEEIMKLKSYKKLLAKHSEDKNLDYESYTYWTKHTVHRNVIQLLEGDAGELTEDESNDIRFYLELAGLVSAMPRYKSKFFPKEKPIRDDKDSRSYTDVGSLFNIQQH
ncbi:hypothetical protein BDN70DRAFT_936905 [Pholiota conissans]|uniref:Uncharacterized protein n=1 Tax=Pholiota conissans TaxID=109636 RepID=A0A9P6CW17_9AGAR|nr:hypothetical protein BDN70DRAFT_936905 [Pholiota conissans]